MYLGIAPGFTVPPVAAVISTISKLNRGNSFNLLGSAAKVPVGKGQVVTDLAIFLDSEI
jgi:hypothetical protein